MEQDKPNPEDIRKQSLRRMNERLGAKEPNQPPAEMVVKPQARILTQDDGTPPSASGKRMAVLVVGGIVALLIAHQLLTPTPTLEPPLTPQRPAPGTIVAAPTVRLIEDGSMPEWGDDPVMPARAMPNGRGTQYANLDGYINIDMVQVAVPTATGGTEFLPGSDPRAKAYLEAPREETAQDDAIREATENVSTTVASDNAAARAVKLPPIPQ